jgi:hypothetical protein
MYNAMRTTAAHMKGSSAGKLKENLASLGDLGLETASQSSGPPETGLQIGTPQTVGSSQPSSEVAGKENGPAIKKKKKSGCGVCNIVTFEFKVCRFQKPNLKPRPRNTLCSNRYDCTGKEKITLVPIKHSGPHPY